MPKTVVHVGLPESAFGERLRAQADRAGMTIEAVSIDAPLEGKAVTVGPDSVVWEGVPLFEAGAIVVEAPLFPWPQPLGVFRGSRTDDDPSRNVAEREARSLGVSALSVVAEVRPVWNRPDAAHLAASPAVALERLERAGIRVHSWKLAPAPEAGDLVLDVVGRDRWYRPSRPGPGEPSLLPDPFPGAVVTVLVAGGAVAGGVRHSSAAAWASVAPGTTFLAPEAERPLADAALAAARVLGLEISAVTLSEHAASVVFLEAGPDLSAWDDSLGGALAPFLAGRLLETVLAQ